MNDKKKVILMIAENSGPIITKLSSEFKTSKEIFYLLDDGFQ